MKEDEKFKYIDDLSMLEIVNLVSIGISSYNFKEHVASDIGIGSKYLPAENIKSQDYIENIERWTKTNLMKLNVDKSKYMIINYTQNYQINTRLYMEEKLLQQISETRLLGLIIRDDLSFKSNTQSIVKRAYKRMLILHIGRFNYCVCIVYKISIRVVCSCMTQCHNKR